MLEQFLTVQDTYLQLARFLITIAVGLFLTRTVLMPLSRKAMASKGSDLKARHSVENIIGLIGLFASFIVALQVGDFGNLVTVLGTIAAALTVAIGFGMRDQVSSVVAGIFIHTDNPFVKGDYIKVNDYEGVVEDIRLRATKLNGKGSAKQVVPNNLLTQNVVKNFTKDRRTRGVVEMSVKQEDLEKTSDLLVESALEQETVLEKPEPEISYLGVEDGKVVTKLSYWLRDSQKVKSVRTRVLEEFNRKAIKEGLLDEAEEE